MKLKPSCRDVTHLLLAGEDRRLGLLERAQVRLHLLICRACPNFERQLQFMRQGLQRWRQRPLDDDPPS
jgi:hypothetical protein